MEELTLSFILATIEHTFTIPGFVILFIISLLAFVKVLYVGVSNYLVASSIAILAPILLMDITKSSIADISNAMDIAIYTGLVVWGFVIGGSVPNMGLLKGKK